MGLTGWGLKTGGERGTSLGGCTLGREQTQVSGFAANLGHHRTSGPTSLFPCLLLEAAGVGAEFAFLVYQTDGAVFAVGACPDRRPDIVRECLS